MITTGQGRMTRLIVALAAAFALTFSPGARAEDTQLDKMRAKISATIGSMMEKLGGSRIIYRVDVDGLREMALTDLRDEVYKDVREGRIAFSGLSIHDGSVEIRIADAKARDQLVHKLAALADSQPGHAITVTDGGDGLLRLTPANAAFAKLQHDLVADSISMIEQRLRDNDIKLAGVLPDGPDRIRIFLPGVTDPERVTAIFAKKVRVSFRLIDESMTPEQAQAGEPPAGTEILFGFKDKVPYLVSKTSELDGDDLLYAAPNLGSNEHEGVASFRFNARGTRRFAHVTAENVGRPFAVVLDDKVFSAPVIREPITGGQGQISGNFTLQEANSVAMLLRAGSLPGHLSLVEQQVVQPAVKP
jgi:preprotein translocase subunit SecD